VKKITKRLKTAKKTEDVLNELERKTNIKRNILARYAICISLINNDEVNYGKDKRGFELNLSTLTGDYDSIFKGLISLILKKEINDNEYINEIKKHCDRGSILLMKIYKITRNTNDFIMKLVNL